MVGVELPDFLGRVAKEAAADVEVETAIEGEFVEMETEPSTEENVPTADE